MSKVPPGPVNDSNPESTANWIWKGTVPSLDGLRGISIGLVGAHHLLLAWNWHGTGVLGFVGVDIFFVISGFLITLLLLREARRNESLSLCGFYFRRACRILPAYCAFLLVLVALQPAGVVPLTPKDWLALLTYTVNFTSVPWEVSHVWSLCVEEHFYLAWPLVMLLLGPQSAWRAALGCILVTPLIRLAIMGFSLDFLDLTKCTLSRMDTIAAGCCLAYLATNPAAFNRLQFSSVRALGIGLALVLILFIAKGALVVLGDPFLVIYSSLNAGAIAGIVWLCVNSVDSFASKLLNFAPLAGLGCLSYSFYLWHKLFVTPNSFGWATQWPVNLVLATLVSVASYFLIEKPFLYLKDRWRTRNLAA